MRSLVRGIGVGLLSSGWLALLSLVLAPLYVHLLGIESYGLIGLYTASLAIGGILDVALSATVSREIAWKMMRLVERNQVGPLLRSVEIVYWILVLVLAMIVLTVGAVLAPSLMHGSSLPKEEIQGALVLMLLSLAIQIPSGLYSTSLIGLNRQAHAAALLAAFGTLRGVGAAFLAWAISDDMRIFFLFHVVIGLIQLLWLRMQTWSYVSVEQAGQAIFTVKSLISIRQAVSAMFLITTMGMMLSQMDKLVLAFMVPLESLGHYTLAWGLASGLTVIATPIVQGFSARFSALVAEGDFDAFENHINMASQMTYVLVIPPAVALFLYAETIMLIWVGDVAVAMAAADLLSLLVLGTAMVACTYPLLFALYAKKEFRPVLRVQFINMLVFFPMLISFVNSWGVRGAAFSWVIYGLVLYLTFFVIIASRFRVRGLLKMLASVILVSLVVFLPFRKFVEQTLSLAEITVMVGVNVIIVCLISASICPEIRKSISKLLKVIRMTASDLKN